MKIRIGSCALLLGMLCSGGAHAMSYVPMTDAALADQADVIVLGDVVARSPMPGDELNATRYDVSVESVLKGQVGASLAVRQLGAAEPERDGALTVPGSVQLQPGERAILFLVPRADGHYDVTQMALGAFHVRTT